MEEPGLDEAGLSTQIEWRSVCNSLVRSCTVSMSPGASGFRAAAPRTTAWQKRSAPEGVLTGWSWPDRKGHNGRQARVFAGKAPPAVEPTDVARHRDGSVLDAPMALVGVGETVQRAGRGVGEEALRTGWPSPPAHNRRRRRARIAQWWDCRQWRRWSLGRRRAAPSAFCRRNPAWRRSPNQRRPTESSKTQSQNPR